MGFEPRLIRVQTRLCAQGAWTIAHAELLQKLVDDCQRSQLASATGIDLSGLTELDTFGAWLLEATRRSAAGEPLRFSDTHERHRPLLELVHTANTREPPPSARPGLVDLALLGHRIVTAWGELLVFVAMVGALANTVARAVANPHLLRLTSAVNHLDRVGWQAVPIISLITFLIGCIISQQGFFHFRRFGADDYVVDMVGILVLRELGVLIVAIMVAGRSASSYTAELGSMKMREEIDALRTMGLDPIEILVLPRVLALICALPLLTLLGSLAALYGAGVVAWLYGGMHPAIFMARLQQAISVTHFEVGMIKAPFMALFIGVIACSEGLQVQGSAESLGLRTTTSVVKSIFVVIVLDGMFAIFFASIGM